MPVLQFKGKTAVENYHHAVAHHRLEFDPKLSLLGKGPGGKSEKPSLEGNLIIEGDNLLALKALLPTHAGKVKCIYIDPPYNTGNEGWVYNDNLTQPQFKEWIGQTVGKEGEDACRHDKWCCMMYPRLMLLKELLHDLGAIFISISDIEIHNLRCLLDEIFGVENFVANIVWQKSKRGDAHLIAVTHEYIVCLVKNVKSLGEKVRWRQRKLGVDEVLAQYDQLVTKHKKNHDKIRVEMQKWYRSLSKVDVRKAHKHYRWSDDRGLYFADNFAGPDDGRESRPRYPIIHPTTKKPCAIPSTGWRWDEDRTKAALAEKPPRIHFGPDETTVPCRKTYLKDVTSEPFASVFYRDGRAGTLTLEQMLEPGLMDFPKDKDTLASLIALCTNEGDMVLDSFAGSGTTAHAVLQLNQQTGKHRKFVLVQQPYDTKEHANDAFNICRKVTAPRVVKAIEGYSTGKKTKVDGLGGTFTYARVGDPLFGEYRDFGKKSPDWQTLARYIFYTETSRECDPKKMNEKTGFIGSTEIAGGHSYYLLYSPDGEENQRVSLKTLPAIVAKDKSRNLVIYAERVWLHGDELAKFEAEHNRKIRPMVIPFGLK